MMRKNLTLFVILLFLGLNNSLFARPIPGDEAEAIAKTVFKKFSTYLSATQSAALTSSYTKTLDGQATYYVFNFAPRGFVIISAEDSYNPVLGFSDESNIDFTDIKSEKNDALFSNMSVNEQRITFMRQNAIEAPSSIRAEWESLKKGDRGLPTRELLGVIVAPLTTTKWDQGKYYNAQCPANSTTTNGPDGRTYCGCAPIAMSQLIKFHNYPARGNASNSYQDPTFGTLSADFCNTTYNWQNMPNELTSPNADVAKFIYHVGVSTNTNYSTTYTSTYVSYVRDALVNFFKFDQAAKWTYDAQYTRFAGLAKADLDAGRPLMLTGTSRNNGGAHAWVVDGYGNFTLTNPSAAAEYFHCNWGWGGDNNGWFLDSGSSWNPLPNQPGGLSSIGYYYDRFVIYNVFPSTSQCQAPSIDDTNASSHTENTVYVNLNVGIKQDIAFRYRVRGTTNWTTTQPTQNASQLLQNLTANTIYEFQTQRKCCPDIWSDFSATDTFRTAPLPTSCAAEAANKLTTSSVTESTAYVYTSQPFGSGKNKQFRYRKVGSADWTINSTSTTYYDLLSGLASGSPYEFQVRHECAPNVWSEYSASANFTTLGGTTNPSNCIVESATALTTSSVGENSAYVYSTEPNGREKNKQFRYRRTGSAEWTTNAITTSYYNSLNGLMAGTTYEFQVRHECSPNVWSDYSASASFRTQGTAQPDNPGTTTCNPESISGLTTSSITASYCYVYTAQPHGRDKMNQFRYRPVGSSTWVESDISTNYFRFLGDLRANTQYEFQVKHDCGGGNWSTYSPSASFTTASN
jgi:hypothetical protein